TNIESLKEFLYKVIFYKKPGDILPNIDMKKEDICMICKSVIDLSLKKSIAILSCKHFYHKEYINDKCPLCQEKTNEIENILFNRQESNCSISLLLNLECTISTLTMRNELTEPTMYNELIEPTMHNELTELTIHNELTELTMHNELTELTILEQHSKQHPKQHSKQHSKQHPKQCPKQHLKQRK
ncbi:520_t:CDS:2, partial [Scutellospora calospora]